MNGRVVLARKAHTCTLCGERIPPRTPYYYERVRPWDHEENEGFFDLRAHERCHEFWRGGYGERMDWTFPASGLEQREFREAMSAAKAAR
ncbi:MAG TPA: hypothetical protein VF234_04890 [Limnochordia bacterium]